MMLDDIKANVKILIVEPWIANAGVIGCLEPAFKQNTNHDDNFYYYYFYYYFYYCF